jgi:hypothetical protein
VIAHGIIVHNLWSMVDPTVSDTSLYGVCHHFFVTILRFLGVLKNLGKVCCCCSYQIMFFPPSKGGSGRGSMWLCGIWSVALSRRLGAAAHRTDRSARMGAAVVRW